MFLYSKTILICFLKYISYQVATKTYNVLIFQNECIAAINLSDVTFFFPLHITLLIALCSLTLKIPWTSFCCVRSASFLKAARIVFYCIVVPQLISHSNEFLFFFYSK